MHAQPSREVISLALLKIFFYTSSRPSLVSFSCLRVRRGVGLVLCEGVYTNFIFFGDSLYMSQFNSHLTWRSFFIFLCLFIPQFSRCLYDSDGALAPVAKLLTLDSLSFCVPSGLAVVDLVVGTRRWRLALKRWGPPGHSVMGVGPGCTQRERPF